MAKTGRPSKGSEKLKSISIDIPLETFEYIEKLAEKDGRARGQVARLILLEGEDEVRSRGGALKISKGRKRRGDSGITRKQSRRSQRVAGLQRRREGDSHSPESPEATPESPQAA